MFKLYNNTKISDEALKPILRQVWRLSKLKGTVLVKFGKGVHGGGTAYRCNLVRSGHLRNKRRNEKGWRDGWVRTSGGYFVFHRLGCWEPLAQAKEIVRTIIHEANHIYAYQNRLPSTAKVNGRRPEHSTRKEEIRAHWAERELMPKLDEELIINLGIEIERCYFSVTSNS